MTKRANFTEDSARRIAKVVRQVEKSPLLQAEGAYRTPAITNNGFWARITDTGYNGKYSWIAQEPQSDGTLDDNGDWGAGAHDDPTGFAVEVQGLQSVDIDTVVWLTAAAGQDHYTFEFDAGLIRFELISPLANTAGAEATAKQVKWTGATYEVVGNAFTIRNVIGVTFGPAVAGYSGWCKRMKDSDVYEIVFMQRVALFVLFSTTETVGATTTGEASATFSYFWRGVQPDSPITVVFSGDSTCYPNGTTGVGAYDRTSNKYNAIEINSQFLITEERPCGTAHPDPIEDKPANHLIFRKGLELEDHDTDDCTTYVDLRFLVSDTDEAVSETPDPLVADKEVAHINFGQGFQVLDDEEETDGPDSCEVTVECEHVDEDQFYLEGSYSEITDADDSYTFDLVTHVECDESELIVVTRTFTFSKCGNLIGISEEDDGGSA